MRTKAVYSNLQRNQLPSLPLTKANRGMVKLMEGWYGEAGGGPTRSRDLCDWFGEPIWLLVGQGGVGI
jgi:hypothetical protein